MCVDCVLTSPRIAHVDPGDGPPPEVVLSQFIFGVFGHWVAGVRLLMTAYT
jgi:hypothetical protein